MFESNMYSISTETGKVVFDPQTVSDDSIITDIEPEKQWKTPELPLGSGVFYDKNVWNNKYNSSRTNKKKANKKWTWQAGKSMIIYE